MKRNISRIARVIRNPRYALDRIRNRLLLGIKSCVYIVFRLFDQKGVFSSSYFLLYGDTRVYSDICIPQAINRSQKITLIATSLNEMDNIREWFDSVLAQTLLPDELIIVDGGSNDGTIEFLKEQAAQTPFPCQIIVEPDANIAKGRNLAIENASNELIASTDFGCTLDPEWLQKITFPFYDDDEIEVVAGFYKIAKGGKLRMRLLGPTADTVIPQTFLPSSRSLAFRKEAWKKVGGYPEWLSLTGEDTIYAINLRRAHCKWAFVPDAIVEWKAPVTMLGYWQKVLMWSKGDGESGFGSNLYQFSLFRILILCFAVFIVFILNTYIIISFSNFWFIFIIAILSLCLLYVFLANFLFNEKIYQLNDLISEIGAEWMRVYGFFTRSTKSTICYETAFSEY